MYRKRRSAMKLLWNDNWKFWKEGSEEKKIITLPHDAMLHEERRKDAEGGSAVGFIRAAFTIMKKYFPLQRSS